MICKYCGTMLPDGSQFCGSCGMKQEPEQPKKKSRAGIVIGCFAASILVSITLCAIIWKVFASIPGIDKVPQLVSLYLASENGDYAYSSEWEDSDDFGFEDSQTTEYTEDTQATTDDVIEPTAGDTCEVTAANRELLGKLQNDYNKINWDAEYQPSEDTNIVISVAKYPTAKGVIVGFTNLYNAPVKVRATGKALDTNGNEVNDVYFTSYALGAGDTGIAIDFSSGDSVLSGDIIWTEFEVDTSDYTASTWEGDYELKSGDNSEMVLKAKCKNTGNKKASMGLFSAMILDKDGKILYYTCEALDEVEAQEEFVVESKIYYLGEKSDIKDIAIFMNPVSYE